MSRVKNYIDKEKSMIDNELNHGMSTATSTEDGIMSILSDYDTDLDKYRLAKILTLMCKDIENLEKKLKKASHED